MQSPCRSAAAIAVAVVALGGCANYLTEQHFDRSVTRPRINDAPDPQMATVYFLRERLWAQSIMYIPIAPLYYGINDQMLAIMPVGSFVRLTLPTGTHRFSLMAIDPGLTSNSVVRRDVDMTVEAGNTYYIGVTNHFPGGAEFGPINSTDGAEMVGQGEPAKIIHNPVSIATFATRVSMTSMFGADKKTSEPPGASRSDQPPPSVADALPSKQQVNDFLEGLAAVALIGLTILAIAGAARGGSGSTATDSGPLVELSSRPHVGSMTSNPAADSPSRQQRTDVQWWESGRKPVWQNSSGTLSEILTSGQALSRPLLNRDR